MFFAFALIFLFCEVGERIISACDRINDEIWMSFWYEFPSDIKKMLSFVISFAQHPIKIHGLGNIQCNRQSFKEVATFVFDLLSPIVQLNITIQNISGTISFLGNLQWIQILYNV